MYIDLLERLVEIGEENLEFQRNLMETMFSGGAQADSQPQGQSGGAQAPSITNLVESINSVDKS